MLEGLQLGNDLKSEKIQNIKELLTCYDDKWENLPELQFYKNIVLYPENNNDMESDDELCECNEDDCGVKV